MTDARPLVLLNPNTDARLTAGMLEVARAAQTTSLPLSGWTAHTGAPLITTEAALADATQAVESLAPDLARVAAGVLVAGFGDPGVASLRGVLDVPVVGIGEASLHEGARGGRRFCVITTTPHLKASIERRVAELGLATNFAGVVLTEHDPLVITHSPALLAEELSRAVDFAIATLGVEAIVIGAGPLAKATAGLHAQVGAVIVAPVVAGIASLEAAVTGQADLIPVRSR